MLNRIFVVDSVTLTSTGTAVSTYTPWDQSTRKLPTQVVIKATGQGAYVRLSNDNSAATNADVLVQAGDHVVLSVQGRRWVSVLSDGASSTVNVGALSTGVSGSAASLDLPFTGVSALDSSITFTRASSATFVGSNGLIQSATTNTPRFDYDPVTLAAKGLLIEEQRTNLLTYSEDITNAAWTKINSPTIASNVATSPDGATTADSIQAVTGGTFQYVAQTATVATNATVTASIYVRKETSETAFGGIGFDFQGGTRRIVYVGVNAVTGVANNLVGGTLTGTVSVFNAGNYWRVNVTATDNGSNTSCSFLYYANLSTDNVNVSGTPAASSAKVIWGAQLEAGSFATSYIPTVASQVTRALDAVSVNTLSPWFNASEGTLFAQGSVYAQIIGGGNPIGIASITNQTANNRLTVGFSNGITSNLVRLVGNGVSVLSTTGGTAAVNSASKIAAAYKTGDSVGYASGVQTGVSATAFTFSPTIMLIGNYIPVTEAFCGHIRRITYYPRRLSNAELQAITA